MEKARKIPFDMINTPCPEKREPCIFYAVFRYKKINSNFSIEDKIAVKVL